MMTPGRAAEGRAPETVHVAQYFGEATGLPDHLRPVSDDCARLASQMIMALADGPELTMGLRKLLEAQDCFIRAANVIGSGDNASAGVIVLDPPESPER